MPIELADRLPQISVLLVELESQINSLIREPVPGRTDIVRENMDVVNDHNRLQAATQTITELCEKYFV